MIIVIVSFSISYRLGKGFEMLRNAKGFFRWRLEERAADIAKNAGAGNETPLWTVGARFVWEERDGDWKRLRPLEDMRGSTFGVWSDLEKTVAAIHIS